MNPFAAALTQLHQAASVLGEQLSQLQTGLSSRSNHAQGLASLAVGPAAFNHSRRWRDGRGRGRQSVPSVVSFPPPFAAITDSLTGGSSKGSGASDSRDVKKAGSKHQPGKGPDEEERILISEVAVVGVDGELKRIAQEALTTRPNFAYTLKEVEEDLRRVFSTGWFSSCTPDAEDTRDGVKLIVKVAANPELKGIVAKGADVLPAKVMQRAFRHLHGRTLNFVAFGKAVEDIDRWYQRRGVLGQVVDFTFEGGVVELSVGEALVNSISLQFLDPKTGTTKEQGATRPDIIMRHLTTAPGRVYNLRQAKQDIDAVYSTGLFEDVNIIPKEADDSTEQQPKVDLTLNLVERKTGGLGAGTGISAQARGEGALPGFVGNFTYSQRNLFGLNQKLSALVELGQADSLFRLQHTDPWIVGDPHRTSRTVSILNNRTSGAAIHAKADPDEAPDAGASRPPSGAAAAGTDAGAAAAGSAAAGGAAGGSGNVVLGRLVGGVEYRRPLSSEWSGTAGLTWQRTRCMDDHGRPLASDCYDAPLTFSGSASDIMALGLASAAYSSPHDGSQLSFSLEQALPLHADWLSFSRLRARLEQPLALGPLELHLRGRAGSVLGDLPPYEAFPLGGTNSIRGYGEGGVGSARTFLEGTAELRWKIVKPVGGVLFIDGGTDLDTGDSVIGDPAGARGKPGSGFGYGAGLRIDSPLGPLRLEYAWNDARQRRFHVGLGYD